MFEGKLKVNRQDLEESSEKGRCLKCDHIHKGDRASLHMRGGVLANHFAWNGRLVQGKGRRQGGGLHPQLRTEETLRC